MEILQYNRDGKELWVSSKGEPCHDAHGEIINYAITQIDLSDQHRQTQEIEQLANAIVVDRAIETETVTPVVLEPEHPANDPALRLAQQLEQLSSADDRIQLQQLVDGLRSRVEECVTILPAEKVTTSVSHADE